jgi:[protein-PII] uridylyltransferase
MARLYEREIIEAERLYDLTRRGCDPLPCYQKFLKLEEHRIFLSHRRGEDGDTVAHHRSALVGALLRHLWRKGIEQIRHSHRVIPPLALLAVGGFGRSQLCPYSDIDLLFLQPSSARENHASKELIEFLLYRLWDLDLKLGYAVRTMEEVVRLANEDLQTKTALLETRFLIGDEALWHAFQTDFPRLCLLGKEKEYLQWRIEDQARRHKEQNGSVFVQEPNVKQSCGGLRDYHHLLWIGRVVLGIENTQGYVEKRFLTVSERKLLERAYGFILRLRHEMHYLQRRAGDTLTLQLQGKIAVALRYQHKSLLRRIEALMRDYYHHAHIVFQTSQWVTNELYERLTRQEQKKIWGLIPVKKNIPRAQVVDGFTLKPEGIEMLRPTQLTEDPRMIIRLFLLSQQRNLKISAELASEVRRRAYMIKRSLFYDHSVSAMILHILSQKGQVARPLRFMHELGVLGKLFPEFAPLTCRVQHEFYHRYTADEHTLQCIEVLDRLVATDYKALERYQQLMHDIERPHLLYLAMLLHDTGKAQNTRDHAGASALCAMRAARRLRLPSQELATLVFLVDHHTSLSEWARRRNLDDHDAILEFARLVKTQERLDLLMLLTYADIQGTAGDVAWSRWSEGLLWMLYRKTRQALIDKDEFIETLKDELKVTREETIRGLQDKVPLDEIEKHFELMPVRYTTGRSAALIQKHILCVHQFLSLQSSDSIKPLAPVIHWEDYPEEDHSIIIIVTWDRERVFVKITGALSAVGLSIVKADIQTRQDNIVVDTFTVMNQRQKAATDLRDKKKFREILTRSLIDPNYTIDQSLSHTLPSPLQATPQYSTNEVPLRINFSNDLDKDFTVIDIRLTDRPNLLYDIAQVLADQELDVSLARITTEKGVAIDTFYVVRRDGKKLDPEIDFSRLRDAIIQRLVPQS